MPSIQPHGATLALDAQSLRVLAASASTLTLFGNPAETLLGKLASELFNDNSTSNIRAMLARKTSLRGKYAVLTWRESAESFYGWLHINKQGLAILDLEPWINDAVQAIQIVCAGIDEIAELAHSKVLAEVLQNAIKVVHERMGFESVLLYQFDDKGNGKVQAQAHSLQATPYLGLYPGSYSKRSSARFKVLRVQQIPRVDYQPSPMLCTPMLMPLKLSRSYLRNAPNRQINDLRTTGVAATLTGSLIVQNQLWGLIECQHLSAPKYVGGAIRSAFLAICNEIGNQITACLAHQTLQARRARAKALKTLLACIKSGNLDDLAEKSRTELLLGAMRADGFTLIIRTRFFSIGQVLNEAELHHLLRQRHVQWLGTTTSFEETLHLDGTPTIVNLLIADLGENKENKLLLFHRHSSSAAPWSNEELSFAKSLRNEILLSNARHLQTEMQLLQRITLTSNVAILITEADFSNPGPRILMANKAFENDTGYRADEVLGRSPRLLQGPNTDPATLYMIHDKLARWEAVQAEVLNYRKDGSTFWVQLNISPIADAYGWVTHWISIQTDVSKRHSFQRGLEQQNLALDASLKQIAALVQTQSTLLSHIDRDVRIPLATILGHTETAQQVLGTPAIVSTALNTVRMNAQQLLDVMNTLGHDAQIESLALTVNAEATQAERTRISKAQFFAAASHDLLQPLNAARIYASALSEQSGISAPVRDIAERIDQALIAAEEIIDALVDVTKLDSHTMAVEIDTFPVYPLLESLVEQLSSMASSRQLQLRVRPCHSLVRSDRRLLRRVLQNLIVNALRYTAKGGVLIATRIRDATMFIEVWDTGIGIDAKNHTLIFEEFSRVNKLSPWGDSGNGLGLAICGRICRLLNHPLTLKSTLGRGSVFRIGIPQLGLVESIPNAVRMQNLDVLAPLKVLCIDNDREILHSLVVLLQGWGLHVLTVEDSASALAVIANYKPEVLLVDQQLGNNELGTELIKELITQLGSTLLGCILITADRSEQLRNICLESGLHFLYKPLKPIRLRSLMMHFSELAVKREQVSL